MNAVNMHTLDILKATILLIKIFLLNTLVNVPLLSDEKKFIASAQS